MRKATLPNGRGAPWSIQVASSIRARVSMSLIWSCSLAAGCSGWVVREWWHVGRGGVGLLHRMF